MKYLFQASTNLSKTEKHFTVENIPAKVTIIFQIVSISKLFFVNLIFRYPWFGFEKKIMRCDFVECNIL